MSTQFPSVWMTPLLILSFGKDKISLPLTATVSEETKFERQTLEGEREAMQHWEEFQMAGSSEY
jgi:hypothetical protein